MDVNRQQFLEDGYVILRQVIPPDQLDSLRHSYEIMVDRQRAIWAQEDPPDGVWGRAAQPRLNLTSLADQIDESTASTIEIWLHENTQGASSQLLGVEDAAVTEMMLMCSPVSDHGPARWHRDFAPAHSSPVMGYAEDILDNGPRYVQWNLSLYDDDVLWVVPGSHVRCLTSDENAQLERDAQAPLSSGVQTHLKAGDGVAYILPILHWASNYSTRMRRTIHGGFSMFTHYPNLSYLKQLSPQARETFGRWVKRSDDTMTRTEIALRAALEADGAAYQQALQDLHPESGSMAMRQSTILLSKSAKRIQDLKRPASGVSEEELSYATGIHPMTMQWGQPMADRFSVAEAGRLWERFRWVDDRLRGDQEATCPGFQGGPTSYFFNDVPAELTVDNFIAQWS